MVQLNVNRTGYRQLSSKKRIKPGFYLVSLTTNETNQLQLTYNCFNNQIWLTPGCFIIFESTEHSRISLPYDYLQFPLSANSKKLEKPQPAPPQQPPEFEVPALYKKGVFNFKTCPSFQNQSDSPSTSDQLETVEEKKNSPDLSKLKRRKIAIVPGRDTNPKPEASSETNAKEYIAMVIIACIVYYVLCTYRVL